MLSTVPKNDNTIPIHRALKHVSAVFELSLKHVSAVFELSLKHVSAVFELSLKHVSAVFELSLKHVSAVVSEDIVHAPNRKPLTLTKAMDEPVKTTKYLRQLADKI